MKQMGYSKLNFIRFLMVLTTIWSLWNAIEPLHSISQATYAVMFLPISTLLLGLTLLQEDKDDDDFGGGIMIPILTKKKYN
mgnify:CR=1 FL=1